jgi:hypothetical protein
MNVIEADLLGSRGANKVDPVHDLYRTLAQSIKTLCNESNVSHFILDHLRQQRDITGIKRAGK